MLLFAIKYHFKSLRAYLFQISSKVQNAQFTKQASRFKIKIFERRKDKMRREGFLVVALSAALCGCSGEVQEQPAAAADYEGYAAVIAQLDEVQSYRVSTVSTDEDYG